MKRLMIYGSIASMMYTRPFLTQDVKIAVAVDSYAEYAAVCRRVAETGKTEGHGIILGGTLANVSPADISPIIRDALGHARRRKVEKVITRVASVEHLIRQALRAARIEPACCYLKAQPMDNAYNRYSID